MALEVEIVTPRSIAWRGQADEVTAPGEMGEFGVLPGHIAFLTTLRPGMLTVRSAGQTRRYKVGEGFCEAGSARVVILAETCEEQTG